MNRPVRTFGIAFVGCGYVSDYYFATLENHPNLALRGIYDRDPERALAFSKTYRVNSYKSLPDLLSDASVDIVVNLTPPRSHYEVSKAALEKGKHVYSEKPLAWSPGESKALQTLAEEKNLKIAAAPCSVLGEAAQTLWKMVREGSLGKVRLVYAELDDGYLLNYAFREWQMPSGAFWPYKDEFETGCTLEHGAYYISWLVAMFGNVKEVISYAAELIPEKYDDFNLNRHSPDFSVGILVFESGVVARITNSIIATRNHSLQVFGDQATATVENAWDYGSPLWLSPPNGDKKSVALCRPFTAKHLAIGSHMDFSRGIAELANSIQEDRPCRLSGDFAMHVDEVCHAISSANLNMPRQVIVSRCNFMSPMEWAT